MKLTNKIIKSSFFCSYKTDLLIKGIEGIKSDYEKMQTEIKNELISKYLLTCKQRGLKIIHNNKISKGTSFNFNIATNVSLTSDFVDISFYAIEADNHSIIPIYFSSYPSIEKYEKEYISCLATLLSTEISVDIKMCKIVYEKESKIFIQKVKTSVYKTRVKERINEIEQLRSPEFWLNKHCTSCEYWHNCNEKAKDENHLSLLSKITPKLIERYKKKGIFTVNQLSYLYKPRRKKAKEKVLVHNIELQALAIRTKKTYVKSIGEINRSKTEIFIDIEALPKLNFSYLFGVVLRAGNKITYTPFWADSKDKQGDILYEFLKLIDSHPDSLIFHYGNFEAKILTSLASKYDINIESIIKRCVNLNSLIYGQVYFPVYSNSLKEIGKFLGVNWNITNANGLQSIVWRYLWENGHHEKKSILIDYNKTDCLALAVLLDKLHDISQFNNTRVNSQNIDFIDNIGKQATDIGKEIHKGFDAILRIAHEDYDSKKMSIHNLARETKTTTTEKESRIGASRKIPRATKIVNVKRKLICPLHKTKLSRTEIVVQRTITDIVFTKNTIRKQVRCFKGVKSYCPVCLKHYNPPQVEQVKTRHFGHGFQAWIIYQRLYLRLPYQIIKTNLSELFNENISPATISNTIKYFSKYYEYTEKRNITLILESPFIHADETRVNVKGKENYVWVFTNGKQIIFKLTETRENKIVKSILSDYKGILISDFYPGYDSMNCNQQKCWVHLIRDINDDLWKNPFDSEFECFVANLNRLIIPIFETIERFGSKKRYLKKHIKVVEDFYASSIDNCKYYSNLTLNYQKRFKKNREKLFVFLQYDNIPWNNNMAERALRHIAVQRKISTFFAEGINDYLLMLGIMQTCRFKDESFLQFLISGKKTLD